MSTVNPPPNPNRTLRFQPLEPPKATTTIAGLLKTYKNVEGEVGRIRNGEEISSMCSWIVIPRPTTPRCVS